MATTPTEVILDWKKAEEHLKNIQTNVMKYAGQHGMNPFLYNSQTILPLFESLVDPEKRNKELYDNIMAIKADVVPSFVSGVEKPSEKK